MKISRLWLLAAFLIGCSGGAAGQPENPTLEPAAQRVEIPNAVMFDGMLLGGVPSADNLKEAKRLGYKTVIDLRAEEGVDEERAAVEALGMTFVNIPVKVPEGINGDNARAVATALAEHQGFFILHCKKGERAAAMMALIAGCKDGKPVEEAVAIGKRAGLAKLEKLVRGAMPARCVAQAGSD